MKHFLGRKPIGRDRGKSRYKTIKHETNKGKENIENLRIQKIVKPENMKDIENLKIYIEIGKKLRIRGKKKKNLII